VLHLGDSDEKTPATYDVHDKPVLTRQGGVSGLPPELNLKSSRRFVGNRARQTRRSSQMLSFPLFISSVSTAAHMDVGKL
jgi:hypothetical protein